MSYPAGSSPERHCPRYQSGDETLHETDLEAPAFHPDHYSPITCQHCREVHTARHT